MIFTYRAGWGRNVGANIKVLDFTLFKDRKNYSASKTGLAIGKGRSYGDSSLNSTGISWDCSSLKSIEIDRQQRIAVCGSGVTIGDLERTALTYGLFPKVVPGTEFVSVGGAVASNIHGKTHQSFGSFGDQLLQLTLMDAEGNLHILSPNGPTKEIFWATVGGMGLTGIIVSASVSLLEVETAFVNCNEVKVDSLKELLGTLKEFDEKFQHTVAWVDLSGDFRGRGIVSGANHAKFNDLPQKLQNKSLSAKIPRNISLPSIFPSRFINYFTVTIFNLFWFHKPLKSGLQHIRPNLHPLDSIRNWNRIYGKRGFIQYQILVPFGKEEFFYFLLRELKKIKGVSFLGVLKSFGNFESKYLSFAGPGWTFAIDINCTNREILLALERLDKALIRVGGRVYLTKDSRLSKEDFKKMYPQYKNWLKIKNSVDPDNFWQSDQGRRLGLC
jgi:decaprenylphospho-beta-D-ribofuranose 2-oxidase